MIAPCIVDAPVPLSKLDSWHWRVKFRCPHAACRRDRAWGGQRGPRVIGWYLIRKSMDWRGTTSYFVEKVRLDPHLKPGPDLPDGTPTFELPEGARDDAYLSSRARAVPVLASAGPTPFRSTGGDPYHASRASARRGGLDYWSIALTGEKAQRPFGPAEPESAAS